MRNIQITDVRQTVFETMQLLKDNKIEVEKAKTVADLAQVMVNSAKVEVEAMKLTGEKFTKFLDDSDLQLDKTLKEIEDKNKKPYEFDSSKKLLAGKNEEEQQ